MSVITISRQLGSQGDEVAQLVGQRLGYRVLHRELLNEAASRAGVPEMALDALDVLGLLDVHPPRKARQAYQKAIRAVVAEVADEGKAVIIGRAGCVLLAERPDVVHIRLIAPLSWRVARLGQTRRLGADAAREQLEASDLFRSAYLKDNFHVDWNDPQLYALVLNMGKLTAQTAALLICQTYSECMLQMRNAPKVNGHRSKYRQ